MTDDDIEKNCGNCRHVFEPYDIPSDRCYKCLESEECDEYWEPVGVSYNG